MKKLKLLKKAIKEIIQNLDEHPVNWPHSHVTAKCFGCENQTVYEHITDWSLNPAAGNVNYCNDPIATPPIQTTWWADDEQWIIDNICQYQPPAPSSCTSLAQPIGGSNWQANIQAHGWETSFECLIEAANNPCALIRNKIKKWSDKIANNVPNSSPYANFPTRIQFAFDLGNNQYSCNNLQNLSPGDATNLTGGSFTWDKPAWITQFTNMINGAGNPCNVLQNKIDGWQDKLDNISSWSVSHQEMLETKIAEAKSLQTSNNC